MASDDHEIHRFAAGRLDDRLAWLAFPDEKGDANAGCPAPRDQLLSCRLATRSDLIDPYPEATAGQAQGTRVDHAHDEQLGFQPARQIEGLQARLLRGR